MSQKKPASRIIKGVVYGPVTSRRFGLSLGINLSGNGKYCSFNCPYCFRGTNMGRPDENAFLRNLPETETVMAAVKDRLGMEDAVTIKDWTIAGNAEPTDHPEFPIIVEALIALRNSAFPDVNISVLTNGMGRGRGTIGRGSKSAVAGSL